LGSEILLGPLQVGRDKVTAASDVIDAASLNAPPLIDEPVTSGGDSALWTRDDDKSDEDQADGPN
jgi:hypothetical protein